MGSTEKRAFFLLKKVNKGIRDYDLIEDGDRIAVAVSGGKDSLSLLKLLNVRRRAVRERYDLVAVHATSSLSCGASLARPQLEEFLREEGVEYSFEDPSLADREDKRAELADCFSCSWKRRKTLFLAAHRLGCNKLAFGHHADDVAHTTLMNLFFHGRLETMEPRVSFFGGKIIVIRPLIYVPEKELARFARTCGLPVSGAQCPMGMTSKRARMAAVLRAVERDCPQAKVNLFRAVRKRHRTSQA
jgi:tRNA 2-thiocytidine biosynthesis protein TtcA